MSIQNSIESRILQLIVDQGLHNGRPLPDESSLLKSFNCSVEELNIALSDMERNGLLKHKDWGWVVEIPTPLGIQDTFSLTRTALLKGHRLDTKVVERRIRLPLDNDDPNSQWEKKAQTLLGLAENQAFIVIVRVRTLVTEESQAPMKTIHRVYLRPDRFPAGFLESHDFEAESLAHIYRQHGYQPATRDTRLQVRLANLDERSQLDIPPYQPILQAEQELYAEDRTGQKILLEILHASYLNWTYEISGRPA